MADLKINVLAKDKTRKAFSGVQASLGRLRSSVFSLQSALIGIGGGLLIRNLVKTGMEIEQLEIKFNFLFQSTKVGAEAFKTLTSFAAKVPFSLEQISAASGNLATITSVAAGGAKELQKVLEITGNVASVTGLDFRMTAEQIQRAFSGGIASADMFRERGVTAMLGFQQGVSYTVEQTQKQFELVFGKNGKFGKATEVMSTTLTGTLSMLGDKLFKFKMDTNQGGFFDFLKTGLALINRQIEANEKGLTSLAQSLSNTLIKMTKFILIGSAQLVDLLRTPFKVVMTSIQGIFEVMRLLPPAVASMGLVGFLLLGTKGRLAIIGIGYLIKKLGVDLTAIANKLGFNVEKTHEWGKSTKAMNKAMETLDSFSADVFKQQKLIYDELNKSAETAKRLAKNFSKFRQEMIDFNEKALTKLTSLSGQLMANLDIAIKGISKGVAEMIVLGKDLAATFTQIVQQILVKMLATMIEIALRISLQVFLEKTALGILINKWITEKLITREKQKQAELEAKKNKANLIGFALSFMGLQHGGALGKGQPSIVGERGPELFIPNTTGQITQHARGTGGGSVNVNFSITTLDASGFSDMLVQNRGTISGIINQAVNERGGSNIV